MSSRGGLPGPPAVTLRRTQAVVFTDFGKVVSELRVGGRFSHDWTNQSNLADRHPSQGVDA
jgi:hypothetical protein